jgi:hypothetical protein
MRFANLLSRFRNTLRRGRQARRSEDSRSRPQLEQLESRLVPSTLQADFGLGGKIVTHYTASAGVNNNVTLSERFLPIISPGQIIRFLRQDVITDTSEKINVIGTAASAFVGSGTNSVATFQPMQSLFVDVLDGNDVVNVQAINYAANVRHIGPGIDTVNVGNAGSLQNILGAVGVTQAGTGSVTHLNVDDSADKANLTKVLLFGGQINNLAPSPIAYNLLGSGDAVTITGGSGNNVYTVDGPLAPTTLNTGGGHNQVNVEATDAGAPLTIQGHGGTDTVIVSSNPAGGNVADIRGTVIVRNTTASTTLTVDDSAGNPFFPKTVTLSDTALLGLAPAAIFYQANGLSAFDSLNVNLGGYAATLTVTNTPATTDLGLSGKGPYRVNVEGLTGFLQIAPHGLAQTGQTTVVVGSSPTGSGGTLANIKGTLAFLDLAGASFTQQSTVIVDDSGDTVARTVNMTASGGFGSNNGQITGLAPAANIRFINDINDVNLIVNGGSGGNTFNVANTEFPLLRTTINGGKGGDTFNVTDTDTPLTINTGTGTNHVNVRGTAGALAVQGHGGSDTVTIGSLAPALGGTLTNLLGAVTVSNTTNSTALIVDDSGDPIFRAVTIAANSIQFSGSAPINFLGGVKSVDVFGGKGGDLFTLVSPSGTTPVTLHGGPASNFLVSGSGFNTFTLTGKNAGTLHNVAFKNVQNLRGGVTSGFNVFAFAPGGSLDGSIIGLGGISELNYQALATPVVANFKLNTATGVGGGVFNVRDAIGGSGTNLFVGNGNNFFLGGSGRSILISGPGPGTLVAGSGEAILIGGNTNWDTNVVALTKIMAEWSRSIPYAQRVFHLMFGGGFNDPFLLNTGTVHSNFARDVLTTGAGLDFVFFDGLDTLTHPPRPGEAFVKV